MLTKNIFDYIKIKEAEYLEGVDVVDGWNWEMKDHVLTSILYKNGQLKTGNKDDKPVKNIVLPILNLEYRAEDIDIKDIQLYVDSSDLYPLSFLLKKYHDDVFVVENDIDTFIDEEKEEMIDLGGALLKNVGEAKPDIIHLQDIAFCNQNDILSSPFCIKHIFAPSDLKAMETRGWGNKENGADTNIDELITLIAENGDVVGRDIEIYEVHGVLPVSFLDEDDNSDEYIKQMHIVSFYTNKDNKKEGISLFRKKQTKDIFKLNKRDNIHNRALGRGGVEELFEDQVWTTYSQIHKKNMLDAASKTLLETDDEKLAARHPSGLKDVDNLEIITVDEGKRIRQIDTFPRNIALFDKWDDELETHARQTGAAQEAIMGEQPHANTPFKSVEFQAAESHSLHNYRIGKHAKFIEELYRDWFIPYMSKEIVKGKKFLSELTLEEMQEIAEKLTDKKVNKHIKEKILSGKIILREEIEALKQKTIEEFMKGGNKKFIEIIKDEFKNSKIKVKINIKDKQKNLGLMTDKLVNVFKQVISSTNPETGENVLDTNPKLAKIFNEILEISGLSPVSYNSVPKQPQPQPQPQI